MFIYMVSLGCAKNLVDSEVAGGRLGMAGFGFTSRLSAADLILINTCAFIKSAREESYAEIGKICRLAKNNQKIGGNCRKFSSHLSSHLSLFLSA